MTVEVRAKNSFSEDRKILIEVVYFDREGEEIGKAAQEANIDEGKTQKVRFLFKTRKIAFAKVQYRIRTTEN